MNTAPSCILLAHRIYKKCIHTIKFLTGRPPQCPRKDPQSDPHNNNLNRPVRVPLRLRPHQRNLGVTMLQRPTPNRQRHKPPKQQRPSHFERPPSPRRPSKSSTKTSLLLLITSRPHPRRHPPPHPRRHQSHVSVPTCHQTTLTAQAPVQVQVQVP